MIVTLDLNLELEYQPFSDSGSGFRFRSSGIVTPLLKSENISAQWLKQKRWTWRVNFARTPTPPPRTISPTKKKVVTTDHPAHESPDDVDVHKSDDDEVPNEDIKKQGEATVSLKIYSLGRQLFPKVFSKFRRPTIPCLGSTSASVSAQHPVERSESTWQNFWNKLTL